MTRYWLPLLAALSLGRTTTTSFAQPATPTTPAPTAPTPPGEWRITSIDALSEWAARQNAQVSVAVWDLDRPRQAQLNPELPLNPASNMKLVTAAVALDKLGPEFTFRTALFGSLTSDGKITKLALRGEGDPSLTEADLWRLANTLRNRGVKHVHTLLVDQTAFDAQTLPPAFEQQPNEWASFRAPISALSVERNTVTLNVLPQTENSPALAWFEPGGIVQVNGAVQTVAKGRGQNIQLSLTPLPDGRLQATLGGHVASGLGRQRFPKRVDDPQLTAGYVLAEALKGLGITVDRVELGVIRDLPLLSYVTSAPLSQLLLPVGKHSDNFTAEMIFKTLSASPHGVASFNASSALVETWLRSRVQLPPGTQIVNGSGLFDANRLSAATLAAVLRDAYHDPARRDVMIAHLAVGGKDGTLSNRLTAPALAGRIRAKTGTLNSSIALSGYILRENTRPPIVFSLLANGVAGKQGEARKHFDAVVSELARH